MISMTLMCVSYCMRFFNTHLYGLVCVSIKLHVSHTPLSYVVRQCDKWQILCESLVIYPERTASGCRGAMCSCFTVLGSRVRPWCFTTWRATSAWQVCACCASSVAWLMHAKSHQCIQCATFSDFSDNSEYSESYESENHNILKCCGIWKFMIIKISKLI